MEAGARDLLRGFSGGFSAEEVAGGDSDEIELGLSLGGCFSSQDAEATPLMRSSSIPAALQSDFPIVVPLPRACSMPSETEEEIRKRKEMQSLKRMEAKRKREEKRNSRRFEDDFESGSSVKTKRLEAEENGCSSSLRRFSLVAQQGSIASQGSSSSGGSEFESRPRKGFEAPASISPSDAGIPPKSPATSERNIRQLSSILPSSATESGTNMMEEMPSVSTRFEGPNGKRIEGFLYRYRKGEVSIVCVCHGSFLTPAEFVKHAGGGDVAHPLRHIVVNPSHSSLL